MKNVIIAVSITGLAALTSCSSEIECECTLNAEYSQIMNFEANFETKESNCYEGLVEYLRDKYKDELDEEELNEDVDMSEVRSAYNCNQL